MPLPDFSELTFGYAFLREFERFYTLGGSFPAAPDFITQASEATAGYDVSVLDGATPVFFQFKRSFVVKSFQANEFKKGHFTERPLYRMALMKKRNYAQHKALRDLEGKGNRVYYVTSQVPDPEMLSEKFVDGRVVADAAALFSPLDIVLPDETKPHYVTFRADEWWGRLYSDEGEPFKRSIRNVADATENVLPNQRASAVENRQRLSRFVDDVTKSSLQARRVRNRIADRFTDPVIQASVIGAYVLDAHLAFFNGPSGSSEKAE